MRRRRGGGERPSHDRWLISYADFITLLFTFFAALYALSSADQAKMEKFSGSLKQVFKVIDEPIQIYEERTTALIEDIRRNIKDVPGASVKSEPRGVVVTFSDAMLFSSGSAEIKQEAFGVLEKLAGSLNSVPGRIIIEGHTDNVPLAKGKYPSNWELSTARAGSVLGFFINKNMGPDRFSIAGYAEFRPLAVNDTEEGKAKNRRVEILIGKI